MTGRYVAGLVKCRDTYGGGSSGLFLFAFGFRADCEGGGASLRINEHLFRFDGPIGLCFEAFELVT